MKSNGNRLTLFKDLITGNVLLQETIIKHAPFLLYLLFLAIVSVWAANRADLKTQRAAALSVEHKELKSEYIESKSRQMQMSMKSRVETLAGEIGLVPQQKPIHQIKKDGE